MKWHLVPAVLALIGAAHRDLCAQEAEPPRGNQAKRDSQKGDLSDLSIEELMQIEVTSASKKSVRLIDTPSAVFVIRSEDIERSGVTTIPEALRMAPGVQVARVDANKWAVSSRGFNDLFSNKLLVLVDGRSVYNPTFSGVYWDVQDLLLGDVERIEVIRGPGGATWGANAVNGVINVISKKAQATQEGLVKVGGGTSERAFTAARYGAKAGEDTYLRVYAKWFDREDSDGGHDGWQQGRAGFRMDWTPAGPDSVTVQGDLYRGRVGTRNTMVSPNPPFAVDTESQTEVTGGNLLGRWERTFAPGDVLTVQGYYDRADRMAPWLREKRDTMDLDVHYRFPVAQIHDVTIGTGYRWTRGDFGNTFTASVTPAVKVDQIATVYAQDEIAIVKDILSFTAGCKLDYNNYTGLEVEPTARMRWTIAENQTLWAAVSRAVRTPSPAEASARNVQAFIPGAPPTEIAFIGNKDYKSETLWAYELGYRIAPDPTLSFDLALFYNDYDRLRSIEPGTPGFEASPSPAHILVPVGPANLMNGHSYGVELAAQWQVVDGVRLHASYSFLKMNLFADSGSADALSEGAERGDPANQVYARLSLDLTEGVRLDGTARYVSVISSNHIPSYFESDVRVAWEAFRNAELSVVGQNLVHRKHLEEATGGLNIQSRPVERGVYAELTVRF
jgi:iron complex outermembrane recepter protein